MTIFQPLATDAHNLSAAPGSGSDEPLTILVHCRISSSEESAFLASLAGRLAEFDRFSGAEGHMVFRHSDGRCVELSILQRFKGKAAHEAWQASPEFARWREAVAPATPTPDHVRRYSGMEAFFVSAQSPDAPPRWKMAVLLLFVVFPMSFAISEWGAPVLARWPTAAGAFATSVVMIVLMTYVLVPALTKVFQGWLAPAKTRG